MRLASVKFYLRGELVKVHPRQPPGGRSTDPADMPQGKEIYATRDIDSLQPSGRARGGHRRLRHRPPRHGAAVDPHAPGLPAARSGGQVGGHRVEEACRRALEAEAVDVNLVARMLERAREATEPDARPDPVVIQGRFARDASEFSSMTEAGR